MDYPELKEFVAKSKIERRSKMRLLPRAWAYIEDTFDGHITIRLFGGREIVVYGFNAMHVAVNILTKRHGWICFHPTMYCFGAWWPWKFYISRNATPWAATFAIGPGLSKSDKANAILRRRGLPVQDY